MKVATVKIDNGEGGFIKINESDFNEETHTLFSDEPSDIDLDALVGSFKEDKEMVKDLKAAALEALCGHFDIEYTNAKTAKTDLMAV